MRHFIILVALIPFSYLFSQERDINGQDQAYYYPTELNGKWYFSNLVDTINQTNNIYDTIHFCTYEYSPPYYLAVKGSDFDFFDDKLKTIVSGKISHFVLTENDLFIKRQKEWTRYNFADNKISTFQADSISSYGDLTYIFFQNRVGVVTNESTVLPSYSRLIPFHDPQNNYAIPLLLTLEKGKYGIINHTGKTIIAPIASIIRHEGYGIIAYKEGNWKYLFPDGKIVDPLGCEIHFYSANHYKIYDEDRTKATFYFNHKLVEAIRAYEDIFPLNNLEYFAVKKNNKIGLLSSSFKLLVLPFCDQIELIDAATNYYKIDEGAGLLKYLQGDKWGVMDIHGKKITQANYDNILTVMNVNNSLFFKIASEGKIGLIDKNEAIVVPAEYQNILHSGNGYVVGQNDKLGYLDLEANIILEVEYTTYLIEFFRRNNSADNMIVFTKNNEFTFINNDPGLLLSSPCVDYQFVNDVLKCYYSDRIEVHVFEGGKIIETSTYPNIQIVEIISPDRFRGYNLQGFPVTTLELNQLTGLFGARNTLRSGLGLKPTYSHQQLTDFDDWFHAGVLNDTNIVFTYNTYLSLVAFNAFNWLNCSNGNFYSDNLLATEIFNQELLGRGSDDSYILYENKAIQWISDTQKDKFDRSIAQYGLLYSDKMTFTYQKVYIGGEILITSIEDADLSMIEYFNYLNAGRNLWFANPEQARKIMNPNLGVKFTKGKLAIRDTRSYDRVGFKYEVQDFVESDQWSYYKYRKRGESTWNISDDLDFKKEPIENIISIQESESQFNDFIIIEKRIKNQNKKGIYSTFLEPLTEIIFDDVIYAGSLGFLVQMNNQYFYVNEFGERLIN